jgi:membrane associated rhomboid family serine protease
MVKLWILRSEFEQRLKTVREKLRGLRMNALLAVSGCGERDGNVCYLCTHKNTFPYSGRSEVISGLKSKLGNS